MCTAKAPLCDVAADLTSCSLGCCRVCGQMPVMATGPCKASVNVLTEPDCGQCNHTECKSRGSAIFFNTFYDTTCGKIFLHLTKNERESTNFMSL